MKQGAIAALSRITPYSWKTAKTNALYTGMIELRQTRKLSCGTTVRRTMRRYSNLRTTTRRSEYGALSRLAKAIGADNQTTGYRYDSQGNRTDPLGHTTSHNYDSLDRLVQTLDPANDSSQTGFDSRRTIKNNRGQTTVYFTIYFMFK